MKANEKQIKIIDALIQKLDAAKYNDISSPMIEGKLRNKLEKEIINDVEGITWRDVRGWSNLLGRILYNLRNY